MDRLTKIGESLILRALDYLLFAGINHDSRMQDALDVLMKKRRGELGVARFADEAA